MIFSTAFSLILGLNITPYAHVEAPALTATAVTTTAPGPSTPISLVAGDEFGLEMFAADQVPMPPKLLARMAAANVPAPNWTITPGQGAIQLAAH
jgi:hypothetical protein